MRLLPAFQTLTLLSLALLPAAALASGSFEDDARFLGEIDTSRAPPVTRKSGKELDLEDQLAFAEGLVRKGMPEAALPFFRQAARAHPERPDVWRLLANTLESVGHEREAREARDRYLALGSTYTPPAATQPRRYEPLASWSPAAASTEPSPARARPTAIVLPDPEPEAPAARAAPEARPAPSRERSARPANRKQVKGMLEALGEL
ncbi:MAG: hypothetical protein P1V51_16310 [Deltaproteobacteria bacterium]|nr:hypothetical protein [Deltaproteobacteria bacterium]